MVLSGCILISKPFITFGCISRNPSSSTSSRKASRITPSKPNQIKQSQPSVAEIERAIGAGIYRDHDPASDTTTEKKSVVDAVLSNSIGKTEGETEKALRQTGEWISGQSEKTTRTYGKKILEIMFLWIAPAWLLLLLVATGAVKLPFSFSALDDLLM
ncbi:probable NAD(P)H dehydrogenase subunit CRR3, chloroplastic [Amaranthus tricolor]|uniref:probable NAD(P)H dehydrogenase subunit CRR3, chloroplastic n=1 Tax=Amaranthus tricolor TaxID=29722 RepID=UPI00258B4261|nr:probable NAD(P)H dehydrogenase subunit CRR3, chloroplastic [Amaranthus tricolor]